MKDRLLAVLLVVAGLLMISGSLFAHHSDSIYDQKRIVTITGTVTQFRFINPHHEIRLSVKNAKGQYDEWITFGGGPNEASRTLGWNSNTFKPGDKLTIYGFHYRDGRPAMTYLKIFRPDGEVTIPTGAKAQFLKNYESAYGKQEFGYKPE